MARFVKDTLYAGTYSVPTDTGRVKVEFTPEKVRHLEQRARDMMAAGLALPISWNHQDDAKPQNAAERLANRAKHNIGHVAAVRLSPEGFLETEWDVPAEADAQRLPAVRFCSPEIVEDYTDGSGRLWPGASITHIAATGNPIQQPQRAIQRIQMSADRPGKVRVVRLSMGDLMADEFPEKKPEGEEKPGEGEKPPEKPLDKPAEPPAANKEASVAMLLTDLAQFGLTLPPDTTSSNVIERLGVAVKVLLAAKAPQQQPQTQPQEQPLTPAPTPTIGLSGDRKADLYAAKLVERERATLETRIKALTTRVGKPVVDKMLADLKTVRLSLDDDANLGRVPLLERVEAYEALDAGNPFGPTRLSGDQLRPAALPREGAAPPQTEAEVEAAVAAWDKTLGRK